jgi:hypothetical protein
MSTGALQPRKETLLIYLPCYLDFQLALDQAKRIREIERNHINKLPLEIEIMISCNGLEFSMIEKQEFSRNCNHVIIFPFGISGDINITQGFMHAIRLEADYLWILSSNDAVSDNFIETITENLIASEGVDILVGCASENLGLRSVHSVFDPTNRDVPFGLISSVVYRIKNMDKNFDSGVQMNWTGWGQLAVIEASCIALTQLNVSLVRESDLYLRSTRSLENQIDEERRVRNGYAHSFFGMPIVISTLHADNPRMRKKYLNGWITSNWYLVNYFLGTDYKLWSSHIASNQIWLRQFAFAAIHNASVLHRIIFNLSKFVNFSALRRYRAAQIIRRMFKS